MAGILRRTVRLTVFYKFDALQRGRRRLAHTWCMRVLKDRRYHGGSERSAKNKNNHAECFDMDSLVPEVMLLSLLFIPRHYNNTYSQVSVSLFHFRVCSERCHQNRHALFS